MDTVMKLLENAQEILGAVAIILSGVITIAALIPGEQPEKALRSVVDFITKFSRK